MHAGPLCPPFQEASCYRSRRSEVLLSTWDLTLWPLILSIVFGGNRNRSSPGQHHPNSEASEEGTIRTCVLFLCFLCCFCFRDREAGQRSVNARWSIIRGRTEWKSDPKLSGSQDWLKSRLQQDSERKHTAKTTPGGTSYRNQPWG